MYKKIMVAIADDEISRSALEEAQYIAATDGAVLCIVHTVTKGMKGIDDDEADNRKAGAALLERARTTATTDATPIVETRLLDAEERYGRTAIMEAIAAAVTEWGADLVVVGTEGRRGLERLVTGSVAEQLVKTVEISILLVRPH
ncbi:universal stress protein [Nitrosospira sp. Nsp1]|uniref:universal stress protein n=1 Tax=Nitrosospira sp. Nsp1 TaxID=136547 RepID=UPI00088ECEBB|nr:universal stress protein [Nitrosospira sp. Nsp1]SCX44429.1 Nucleotide-binding universal stress protein, UspA family [Nitrosospira sp. Nsp1]